MCNHTQFIDSDNNILYLFGDNTNEMCSINLKTKKIINTEATTKLSKLVKVELSAAFVHIPHPLNQVHIIDDQYYWKVDVKNKIVNKKDRGSKLACCSNPNLLYIPSRKKLMIFGSYKNNKIWQKDIDDNSEWELYALEMPHCVSFYYLLKHKWYKTK